MSAAAFEDLLKLEEILSEARDPLATELLHYVLDALQVLTHQPCIGRPVAGVVDAQNTATSAGVIFHPATAVDADTVAQV